MGQNSKIEWTDTTWNPIRGCSRVSDGCRNCYAESIAARFSGRERPYEGLAAFKDGQAHWTSEVRFIERHLEDPLHWKKPQKIFVNSMSDLFHPGVLDAWLVQIFDVMAKARQHTYQILTKRPDRMLDVLRAAGAPAVAQAFENTYEQSWPPANWWFGVSVEDQGTANRRLPILAQCSAAVRFVSYEPAIGHVDFAAALGGNPAAVAAFDWIICGGESCPHARPMQPEWAREIRDMCSVLGIPFFMKQMGGRGGHNDVPIPEDLAIKEFPRC
jgi:protein gp37